MEMNRKRFTARDYRYIVLALFDEAARGGCDSESLVAHVYNNDKYVMRVESQTRALEFYGMRDSELVVDILAGNANEVTVPVRRMVLAA